MSVVLCVLYFAVLACLVVYGLHRLYLVTLCWRHRDYLARAPRWVECRRADAELPHVTIQLPIFNEATVVVRLLESVAAIDYPRDRLQVQVLDDSTDETQALLTTQVARLRALGLDVVYLHRNNRSGYKAGALDHGLRSAKGELIAVFDADFVPTRDFLRAIVGHFDDPTVAMVQTRWAHLNRGANLLTRVQALMLDGHHLVENRGRYGAGLLFNFSGTGGIWRRRAIEDAGGWQLDTITEDLDLSYRAQLKGWRFIYRSDVVSPAEVPEDIAALRAQQHRWAKGTVQTARKLLGRVWAADLTRAQRIEAFFHLTPHFVYPLTLALVLLLLPVLAAAPAGDVGTMILMDLPLCLAAFSSLAGFFMHAESTLGRSRLGALALLPAIIAVGTGMAPFLSAAVVQGLRTRGGRFVRTPKRGADRWRYQARVAFPVVEIFCGLVTASSAVISVLRGHWLATPFAILFTLGFGYVSAAIISEQLARRRGAVSTVGRPLVVTGERAELGRLWSREHSSG